MLKLTHVSTPVVPAWVATSTLPPPSYTGKGLTSPKFVIATAGHVRVTLPIGAHHQIAFTRQTAH